MRATASHLADNVIILSYYHDQRHVKRELSVIKTRAGGHDPAVREFAVSSAGIAISDAVTTGDPQVPGGESGPDR